MTSTIVALNGDGGRTPSKKNGTGVVVGRFQVPSLHAGHHHVIARANRHQRLIIVVGCGPVSGTRREPLDYATREAMLREAYPNAIISPLSDHPSDEQWSLSLDELIKLHVPVGDITIYGSRDSFIPYYKGEFNTYEVEEVDVSPSGTDLRREIGFEPINSVDFRRGCIYTTANKRDTAVLAVDLAIFKEVEGKRKLLLVNPKIRPRELKLPGKIVDPSSPTISKEIKSISSDLGLTTNRLICDDEAAWDPAATCVPVTDWRNKEGSKIWTVLYVDQYLFGGVRTDFRSKYCGHVWVDEDIDPSTLLIMPEHKSLVKVALKAIRK